MQWHDIQKEIDRLFKFERKISAPYLGLKIANESLRSVPFTNIRLQSEDFRVFAIAPHYHEENQGAVIYEYSYDKEIRNTGDQMPEPLSMLKDCEHHYYGLKLNCLAYLSGKPIKSLVLRDCYNGVSIPIRFNPSVAAKFLSSLTHSDLPASGIKPKEKQFALSF